MAPPRQTHCKNGHEFTEENTYSEAGNRWGHRRCRICRTKYMREYRADSEKVPVSLLQEAFTESPLTASDLARALDWWRDRGGRMVPDQSRVMRTLGLRQYKPGVDRTHLVRKAVQYDTALKVVRALGADPWEVGL